MADQNQKGPQPNERAVQQTPKAAAQTEPAEKRYVVVHKAVTARRNTYTECEVVDGSVFGDALAIERLVGLGAIREATASEVELNRVHSATAPSAENKSFEDQLRERDNHIAELQARIDELQGRLERAERTTPPATGTGGTPAPAAPKPAPSGPSGAPPPPPPPGGAK